MKIVVLDGYAANPGDIPWDAMRALGELTVYPRTKEEEILERIQDAEAVFTNKAPISRQTIEASPSLKFIGVLATGYNIVDIEAAKERGIVVSNIPAYSTDSVAQIVFALLLEICHHVGEHTRAIQEGRWEKSEDFCFWDFPLMELAGKTFGIVGMGDIGKAVAKLAKAFGMKVVTYTPHPKPIEGVTYLTLDELWATADIISLHCPLFETTKHMVDKEAIRKMKKGVILINTARGPLVDEQALYEGLESGTISWAAFDVMEKEPPEQGNRLLRHPRVIATPHIGWAPFEARVRLMKIAVENLKAFQEGKPIHVVNE